LQGEFTLALIAFNDALRTTPDLAPAHYGSGNAYMATNLPIEAVKSYQRTVQLLPGFARAHKALGDALSRTGNRHDANASYARAKQLGYGGPDLGLAVARNLMAERRWLPALDELKSLAEKAPSAEVFLATGECYEGLSNSFSAAMAFFKATDLDHNSSIAYYKLGLVLLSHREHAAAKDAFERAIALDPRGEKINVVHARDRLKEAFS
jgi:tetratricopeptide (TPR) repeat protein